MRFVAVAVALWRLGGCKTIPYGPLDGETPPVYGYRETANGPNRYVLTMVGPANASMQDMHEMWERRAGELCQSGDFTKRMFRAERPTTLYGYYGGAPGAPILEGFLDCAGGPIDAAGTDAAATAAPAPAPENH